MEQGEDWNTVLRGHPIFALPESVSGPNGKGEASLELSLETLGDFTNIDPEKDGPTPSGRRQVMVIKDADLIVAAGSEIRITSLGDSKPSKGGPQSFKVLHTPNVTFEIRSMVLNPNSKLLAVVGAFQVAVVALPRPGFSRLVSSTIDCKSIQVGQYYHASSTSSPVAKVEWHPWGNGGTTLLVMTTDGKFREYDITVDTEEPLQVLSFVPERKSRSYYAENVTQREVASFTLGKGSADWGPLSVYALMKSGDIYSICPYMPQNASIPSSYVHALECFVHAKKEFLSQSDLEGPSTHSLSTLYEYQHKYVEALRRQLPPGTVFPAVSRPVLMTPPKIIKSDPIRQGPFLLQPSPRDMECEEDIATDLTYLTFGAPDELDEDEGETERLGVMLVAYQEGKVDVCLDVEKVEAKWEHRGHTTTDLPMLAVYETVDLGFLSMLSKASQSDPKSEVYKLVQGNHPVFLRDPIQDEAVYVYHAFGVHALQLGPLLKGLAAAIRDDNSNDGDNAHLTDALEQAGSTLVQPIVNTFSIERKCSNPIIGVTVPSDVYLTYSIFILSSAMRIICFPLLLHTETPQTPEESFSVSVGPGGLSASQRSAPPEETGPPPYVSLLKEPFVPPPALTRPSGLPSNPTLAPPPNPRAEFQLTPETLRFLGATFEKFMSQIRDVKIAYNTTTLRSELQKQEFRRQQEKCRDMINLVDHLHGARQEAMKARFEKVEETQKELLARLERILRGLMKDASPELSEHERKWFDELSRMKAEVVGVKSYDQNSFQTRTALLRRELDRLTPSLRELNEKEQRLKKKLSDKQGKLGLSQAFEFGERSNAERAKISRIEEDITVLAERLEITLGRAPSMPPGSDDV